MNAAQRMEAVLTHATTHRAHTVAPVDQVSHRLPMESLAQVMYSSQHLYKIILRMMYSQTILSRKQNSGHSSASGNQVSCLLPMVGLAQVV